MIEGRVFEADDAEQDSQVGEVRGIYPQSRRAKLSRKQLEIEHLPRLPRCSRLRFGVDLTTFISNTLITDLACWTADGPDSDLWSAFLSGLNKLSSDLFDPSKSSLPSLF